MTTPTSHTVPATTEFLRQHFRPRPRVGEVALVTGGTQGIGKEVARTLVRAGVTTVLAPRAAETAPAAATELSADAAEGARAVFHPVDLADAGSIAELAGFVADEFGRLDILVNDAARGYPPKSASAVTADEMRTVFEVNVFAVVTLTSALLPLLEAAGSSTSPPSAAPSASVRPRPPTTCAARPATPHRPAPWLTGSRSSP